MLIPKSELARKWGRALALWPMQIRIRGGEHETDVNEFAVMPYGVPSLPLTVATVMPVANRAHARRNVTASMGARERSDELDKSVTSILS
jgi:hypothetical protein